METPENYLSTIILQNNLGFQEVYSSQNYGTFYSIYMSFDIEHLAADKVKIKNIIFKIINYKGVLNLGIKRVEDAFTPKDDELQFNIEVQAMHGDREYSPNDITFDPNKIKKVIINRTLMKLSNFQSDINPNDNSVLVFDNEYYYRDGTNPPADRIHWMGMEDPTGGASGRRCYQVKNRIVF